MNVHLSGKRVAAGITTVAALGSIAVAGVGAVSLDSATASPAVASTSLTGVINGPSQVPPVKNSPGGNNDSSVEKARPLKNAPEAKKTSRIQRNSSSIQQRKVVKSSPTRRAAPVKAPVKQGNGAASHSRSSGS